MPAFADPFSFNVDRKITKDELVQAIRVDIAGELEAIYLYDAHIQATDDIVVKEILADIRDEEKLHVGQLMRLLSYLDPDGAVHFNEGQEEGQEMIESLAKTALQANTVGSLIEE
ncbi:demethoxyubiquinone hydroxylase family protein [Mycoplasma sp. P36-A1]|uniref:demethoxyubiquinone hydroxylase family protein n=1 Tax=Mycoplasma sp. P36-A1 TaxID=3252900 RepID=UPI003C2AD509